jgi:hypothetical protein
MFTDLQGKPFSHNRQVIHSKGYWEQSKGWERRRFKGAV